MKRVLLIAVVILGCLLVGSSSPVQAQNGTGWRYWPEMVTGPENAYWYVGEQGDVSTYAVIKVRRDGLYDYWIGSYLPGTYKVRVRGNFYRIRVISGSYGLRVYYKHAPELDMPDYVGRIGSAAAITKGTYYPDPGDVFAAGYVPWGEKPLWSWRVEHSCLVVKSRDTYWGARMYIPPSEPITARLVGAGSCLWVEATWMQGSDLRIEVDSCGGP